MSESGAQTSGGADDRPSLRETPVVRETLTRVLAREARNTLARVELAASELARFEASPAVMERIDTIRDAVGEIDEMLGKVDLLAGPPKRDLWPGLEIEPVWRRVLARLAPTLSARGIEARLEITTSGARVAIPEATLEAIFCAYVRLMLPAAARSGRLAIAIEAGDGTIRVARAVDPAGDLRDDREGDLDAAEDLAGDPRAGCGLPADSADQTLVEFEVLLAEWGGALADAGAQAGEADATSHDGSGHGWFERVPAASSGRWTFWLPEAGSHG